MQSCEGGGRRVSAVAASSILGLVAFTNASAAGFLRRTPFRKALERNPDVAASRAGALPFRNSNFIGNYNSQQRGTDMAVSAFQLLGNTLSVGQSLSTVPKSMLSKKWLGAECTQYSELSVIILGEPPPSDT